MRRTEFLMLVGGGALAWPTPLLAQPTDRIRRIGVLFGRPERDPEGLAQLAALRQGLQARGWTEERNVMFIVRYAEGRPDRAPAFAAELINSKVDIIVTSGTEMIQAAQKASGGIPVVMAGIGDPVGAGIVASLARPGGNVTGLSLISPQLAAKRLELAKEVIPALARVAILWNPSNASLRLRFQETTAAAQVMGLKLESIEVHRPDDLERSLNAAARAGAQALLTTEDILMTTHRKQIVQLAMRHRMPPISGLREFAEAGGLLSYGPSLVDLWRRAAAYVDRILKGTKPANLPVEQPMKFELVINARAAKELSLTIPASVLARADEIIR